MENSNIEMKQPLMVSIRCLAYNHEAYIRQCLDGFVMQQTNFRFEAIVHDDASTDHTADIIREYAKKYPNIIKPIYETENQYSKQDGSLRRIMNDACKGKYIAMCEGDDYWTDPLKLQKQVDFLEEHPDFSLCFHNVKIWKQKEGVLVDDFITRDVYSETDIYELAKGNYIHTPSVVFRNDKRVFDSFSKMGKISVGDYPLWMLSAQYGKIKKMGECMVIYRYGSGYWSTENDFKKIITWMQMIAKLIVVLDGEKVKMILEEQNRNYSRQIHDMYEKANVNYMSLLNSQSYRLGNFLLKPFRILKKFFK